MIMAKYAQSIATAFLLLCGKNKQHLIKIATNDADAYSGQKLLTKTFTMVGSFH